jgi:hypothetical protein
MAGIKCPHCRSTVALDRVGVHFQKFCPAAKTPAEQEASLKRYNQLYTHIQSQARGEITLDELQKLADKIFAAK